MRKLDDQLKKEKDFGSDMVGRLSEAELHLANYMRRLGLGASPIVVSDPDLQALLDVLT